MRCLKHLQKHTAGLNLQTVKPFLFAETKKSGKASYNLDRSFFAGWHYRAAVTT